MWRLSPLPTTSSKLWFSDGNEIGAPRGGGIGSSVRLMVENQGFLDFTEFAAKEQPEQRVLDLNGARINYVVNDPVSSFPINLTLPGDGTFSFTTTSSTGLVATLEGPLKPLPDISSDDIKYIRARIQSQYIPYPQPGKTPEEIRKDLEKRGQQYFPWSQYSFELAMVTYDWTTASFARMVIPKMFEYAQMATPRPIDTDSTASAIFDSNWPPYTPANADYMRSFLMVPAKSRQEVMNQLVGTSGSSGVQEALKRFTATQNSILSIAVHCLPRTPRFTTPYLYSGQLDMSQLHKDQFAAAFLQFELNKGPPGVILAQDFTVTTESLVQPYDIITTKQVWSFGDTLDIALHYQNGIILVINGNSPLSDSAVWDTPAFVTHLSNDLEKIEWVVPPGTSFLVTTSEWRVINGKQIYVIVLELLDDTAIGNVGTAVSAAAKQMPSTVHELAGAFSSTGLDGLKAALPLPQLPAFETLPVRKTRDREFDHLNREKTNGRRCRCLDAIH
ncbi:hypothetical protein VNI00_007029 [Paramarasmius palmivorus]|uniref:Uncharacterized protein n=1 Tax=Paramarasmius palmivorus TaxID=297713 RepID=A0AAW0D2R5_9AGAR